MKSKEAFNYNLLFPLYLLWLLPSIWLFILPANFLIDSAVVLLALHWSKQSKFVIYKKIILQVWGYGFLADFIGSVFLFAVSQVIYVIADSGDFSNANKQALYSLSSAIDYNPYGNFFALVLTLVAIFLSGICIYHFNLKRTLKNVEMVAKHKKRISLFLAIVTAPYMFLIPAYLFF